jgi:hypothetical protein
MRIMYDSTRPSIGIPGSAEMVGYYYNGTFAVASVAAVRLLFPRAVRVPIDVNGSAAHFARVLDVEKGDATPDDCEGWIAAFGVDNAAYRSGGRPVIYVEKSNIAAVRAGTGRYQLGRDYYLWVASWGNPYTGPGVVACQVENTPLWDRSEVYSDQWMPAA